MSFRLESFDHLVLTVADIGTPCDFYRRDPDGNLIEIANAIG